VAGSKYLGGTVWQRILYSRCGSASQGQRGVSSFTTWVEASHIDRHQPGAEEVPQPPADIAILAISTMVFQAYLGLTANLAESAS
jgi:hypothetical protein